MMNRLNYLSRFSVDLDPDLVRAVEVERAILADCAPGKMCLMVRLETMLELRIAESALRAGVRLVAISGDPMQLSFARSHLDQFRDNFGAIHGLPEQAGEILGTIGISGLDLILHPPGFDLVVLHPWCRAGTVAHGIPEI